MDSNFTSEKSFHLAGIVPVAGQPMDFSMPWHDCMMPIAPDYLAVERAVAECAMAGCETIWLICNDDMKPLIKHRLGDYIKDPVSLGRTYASHATEKREIPIFYVPIHPKDRGKRDCLGWSVLHGALSAYHISRKMSKWLTPDKYYVAFPHGTYDIDILREYRKDISSERNLFLEYNGFSVRDGLYLGFTFGPEDYKRYVRTVRSKGTGIKRPGQTGIPSERLPPSERYSARFFSLDTVFETADINYSKIVDVSWYYGIDSWELYCDFLSSPHRLLMAKPKHLFGGKFNKWNS